MPLTALHCLTGAFTGGAVYAVERLLIDAEIEPGELQRAAVIGALAGSMPDILEPPFHRRHRSLFHSRLTQLAAVVFFIVMETDNMMTPEDKSQMRSMLAAYLSHLLLDSTTPMGLPLVF